ncbi:hypothetical protein EVAR_10237_1 [Eumeta japonica]|uniref:Uncharacterized protein n=1 Tax=Eumeta variegata TaxID=151549 RepID=A0A4C1TDN4_EUMVA|nr:hypothetical protein EVAR_10237_1 [Eumeta japonica]
MTSGSLAEAGGVFKVNPLELNIQLGVPRGAARRVSRNARLAIRNGIVISTLMYDSECWVWQKKNESRINVMDMRNMCAVSPKDRYRNSDVKERCGLEEDVVTRVEKGKYIVFWSINMGRDGQGKCRLRKDARS